jgi:hypothetical protein
MSFHHSITTLMSTPPTPFSEPSRCGSSIAIAPQPSHVERLIHIVTTLLRDTWDVIDRPANSVWPIKQPLFRCPSPDGIWLRECDKRQINRWLSGDIDKNAFVSCDELHWGLCNIRHMQAFGIVFGRALKMYIPVHFIPVLLWKRSKLFKRWCISHRAIDVGWQTEPL